MRAALRVLRHGLRLLPLVVVLALVVPGSGVRPTTIGLMKVQPAEAYDFADGVKRASLFARLLAGSIEAPVVGPLVARLEKRPILGRVLRGGLAGPPSPPRPLPR